MVLRPKELYALNRLGIANQVVVDQRNREFIDESVCTSAAIPITELSCRIPLATFHEGEKSERQREREKEGGRIKKNMSDKRLQIRSMTGTNDPELDLPIHWSSF